MGWQKLDKERFEGKAGVFAAVGRPTRLALLLRLAERPYSVNELANAVGARQANISQQLGILKRAGLVRSARSGTSVTYSTDGPEVERVLRVAIELHHRILRRRTCVPNEDRS